MNIRLRARVTRRPSLPLTEQNDADLALIRTSPAHRRALAEVGGLPDDIDAPSESALLHAVFEAGLSAVHQSAAEAGYAELAAQQGPKPTERRAVARRRRPDWADEE
ncbi:MAG: hypothetical protein ACRCZD_12110 [Phycicoccus sp.]